MENKNLKPAGVKIGDGNVLANDEFWVVYKDYDQSYHIKSCKLVYTYYDPRFGEMLMLHIKYSKGENVSSTSIARVEAGELCFKDYDKAEAKRVEMIMCE